MFQFSNIDASTELENLVDQKENAGLINENNKNNDSNNQSKLTNKEKQNLNLNNNNYNNNMENINSQSNSNAANNIANEENIQINIEKTENNIQFISVTNNNKTSTEVNSIDNTSNLVQNVDIHNNSKNHNNNVNNNEENLKSNDDDSINNTFENNMLEPRIAVIGVGGGGCNAINTMKKELDSLSGVVCISANTDSQVLKYASSEIIIQLGPNCTRGLGAGANPEVGKQAALESEVEIRKVLQKIDMVFIAAGMGGGTGTGAAPLIAKIAKEMGILTVAVVTIPFSFEGARRAKVANKGAEELMKTADSVVIVPNDKLLNIINDRTPLSDAFKMADDVLCNGVKCILELIMKPGLINLDFADIRTIMSNMQTAFLSIGKASGEDRALRAAEIAINNPLSNVSLKGAESLLINISGGSDLTLYEINTAVAKILAERGEHSVDANILVGATYNEKLIDELIVYIIATGIHDDTKKTKESNSLLNLESNLNSNIESIIQGQNSSNIQNSNFATSASKNNTKINQDNLANNIKNDYSAKNNIEDFYFTKNTNTNNTDNKDLNDNSNDLKNINNFNYSNNNLNQIEEKPSFFQFKSRKDSKN